MRLLALLAVLSAVFLGRAGAAFADDPEGVITTELIYAPPIEFPSDTVMIIEAGCSHCDVSAQGYYRVYRGSTGQARVEPISVRGRAAY